MQRPISSNILAFGIRPVKCNSEVIARAVPEQSRCHAGESDATSAINKVQRLGI